MQISSSRVSVAFWNVYTVVWLIWVFSFQSFSTLSAYSTFEAISEEYFWLLIVSPIALLSIYFFCKNHRRLYQLSQSIVFAFWSTVFIFFLLSNDPFSTGTITYFAIAVEFLILTVQTSFNMPQ